MWRNVACLRNGNQELDGYKELVIGNLRAYLKIPKRSQEVFFSDLRRGRGKNGLPSSVGYADQSKKSGIK